MTKQKPQQQQTAHAKGRLVQAFEGLWRSGKQHPPPDLHLRCMGTAYPKTWWTEKKKKRGSRREVRGGQRTVQKGGRSMSDDGPRRLAAEWPHGEGAECVSQQRIRCYWIFLDHSSFTYNFEEKGSPMEYIITESDNCTSQCAPNELNHILTD